MHLDSQLASASVQLTEEDYLYREPYVGSGGTPMPSASGDRLYRYLFDPGFAFIETREEDSHALRRDSDQRHGSSHDESPFLGATAMPSMQGSSTDLHSADASPHIPLSTRLEERNREEKRHDPLANVKTLT